jgi:uncharacterized membrane protein YgcG
MIMRNKIRGSIVAALAAAVTLTSFNLSPAQAASKNTPQVANAVTTDFSARRYRHRGNNAAALAMFGIVAGSIAAAAAADRYDDGYYYGGGPYYGGYGYRHGGYHRGGWHGGGGRIGGGHGGGGHVGGGGGGHGHAPASAAR